MPEIMNAGPIPYRPLGLIALLSERIGKNNTLFVAMTLVIGVIRALILISHIRLSTSRLREIRAELEARRGKV